jgi:hypothetical protein
VLEIRQLVLRSLCDCNDTLSIEDNDAKIDNQLNLISKNGLVNLHPLINLQLGKKKPYHLRMVELLIGNCVKREESLSNSSLRILSDYYHKNREYRKLNKLIEYFYNEITEVPSKLELKALTHFALGEFTISKAYFISILQSMNLKPKSKTLNQVNLVFTLHKLGLINEAMKL